MRPGSTKFAIVILGTVTLFSGLAGVGQAAGLESTGQYSTLAAEQCREHASSSIPLQARAF
jgi:DNA-binding phage protein